MDEEEESQSIFLQKSGKFFNKNLRQEELCTIWNYPIRGHLWKIQKIAFDYRNGDFATVDERGQIYWYSLTDNLYTLIRKAAAAVVAIDFVPDTSKQIIIAYENGAILILDVDTKNIVAHVPHLREIKSPPESICSHLKSPVSAIAYNNSITMWNLKTMSCIASLGLSEPLLACDYVDVNSPLSAKAKPRSYVFVAVSGALREEGCVTPIVVVYDCKTFEVCTECHCPVSERSPSSYTAYCTIEQMSKGSKNVVGNKVKSGNTQRYTIMCGSDGLLYVWEVFLQYQEQSTKKKVKKSGYGEEEEEEDIIKVDSSSRTNYLGAVELPVKMQYAVGIQQLGDRECSPRIGILSVEGHFIIVDVEGICNGTVGNWTIVAELSPERIIGTKLTQDIHKNKTNSTAPVSKKDLNNQRHQPCFDYVGCRDKFVSYDDYISTVGIDGAVRVLNSQLLVGQSPTSVKGVTGCHYLVGRSLRARDKRRYDVVDDMPEVVVSKFELVDSGAPKRVTKEEKRRKSNEKWSARHRQEMVEHRHEVEQLKREKERVDDENEYVANSNENNENISTNEQNQQPPVEKHSVSDEQAKLPLFELAYIMPKDRELNETKLKYFLKKNGCYPERYRPLIWRFVLKLPENSAIFTDLARRGIHPAFEELYSRFPLQNSRMFTRLQTICSMIAHWSPIFAEVPYIPVIVFPFLLVHTRDDLAVLETIITFLMWWGYSFQVTFPNPPIHIVNALDNLLKEHDPKLYSHLTGLKRDSSGLSGISSNASNFSNNIANNLASSVGNQKNTGLSPGLVCWVMISTMFTEILSKDGWLQLMDHIFTHHDRLPLLLLAPIAILRITRSAIVQSNSYKAANPFYRRQQHVDMTQVLTMMYSMLKNTPAKLLIGLHCPSSVVHTSHNGKKKVNSVASIAADIGITVHGVNSIQETIGDVAVEEGTPVFPLPKSTSNYPAYDGFPKTIIDYQLMNREKTLELHNEATERKKILRQLELKISQVETEHQRWMAKHKSISQAEVEHRKNMMMKEKAHLLELRGIEEEISKARIQSLGVMETVAKEEMQLLDEIGDETRRLMSQGEAHLNEKMEIAMSVQKHRELAAQAEQTSMQHMRKLQMHRTREDWAHSLDSVFKSKEEEIEAKNALLAEEWRAQDEATKLRNMQKEEKARSEAQQEKYMDMQQDMSGRLQKLYLARQAKVMEIERNRSMRLAKEQADEAIAVANRSALLLQKQELAASVEEDAIFSERSVKMAQERLLTTIDRIKEEGEKLVDAERVFALKQQKARQNARLAQLRKEWSEKQGKQLQKTVEAERYAQEQIIRMKKAAARVGVEVEQPIPTSITGISKGNNGGTSRDNGVPGGVRQYYEDAEVRLADVANKILAEQRRKYDEVDVSQRPHRDGGRVGLDTSNDEEEDHDDDDDDDEALSYSSAISGNGDGGHKIGQRHHEMYRPKNSSSSSSREQQQSATVKDGTYKSASSSYKSVSTGPYRHEEEEDSSDDDEEEYIDAARRNQHMILSDEEDDDPMTGPSRNQGISRSSSTSSKQKNSIPSDLANSASSYLKKYDNERGGRGGSQKGSSAPAYMENDEDDDDEEEAGYRKEETSNLRASTARNSSSSSSVSASMSKQRSVKSTMAFEESALEKVTGESIRSLNELRDELKAEELEDAEDMHPYSSNQGGSSGKVKGGTTRRRQVSSSEEGSGNDIPAGTDDDSALWNYHDSEESTEEEGAAAASKNRQVASPARSVEEVDASRAATIMSSTKNSSLSQSQSSTTTSSSSSNTSSGGKHKKKGAKHQISSGRRTIIW